MVCVCAICVWISVCVRVGGRYQTTLDQLTGEALDKHRVSARDCVRMHVCVVCGYAHVP